MLFSVLIPVYNAEKYLDACLQSVIDQTEQDFEIILCDDGSTDNSFPLCKAYKIKYPDTIRLLQNSEKEGPLMTRRRMFSASSGEYVLYADADDQLEPKALELLKEAICKTDADMVLFDATCIHLDGAVEDIRPSLEENRLYQSDEKMMCYEAFLQSNRMNSLCTKAFRRDLMDITVDYSPWRQLSLGEDRFQSFPLFDRADSVYYLDQTLYRYHKRESSITTNAKPRFYEMRKILWTREDGYLASWHISRETMEKCSRTRSHEIIRYAVETASSHSFGAFRREMYQIRQDGWFSRAMEKARLSGRYRFYGKLLLWNAMLPLYVSLRAESALTRSGASARLFRFRKKRPDETGPVSNIR